MLPNDTYVLPIYYCPASNTLGTSCNVKFAVLVYLIETRM